MCNTFLDQVAVDSASANACKLMYPAQVAALVFSRDYHDEVQPTCTMCAVWRTNTQ